MRFLRFFPIFVVVAALALSALATDAAAGKDSRYARKLSEEELEIKAIEIKESEIKAESEEKAKRDLQEVPAREKAEAAAERPEVAGEAKGGEFDLGLGKEIHEGTLANPPGEYALADCIELALERNQRLKAAGYDVEAAEGQLVETKALFKPIFEYQWRIAPVPTDVNNAWSLFWRGQLTLYNSIHVALAMPVNTFGKLSSAKRMAQNGVEAAKVNEIKTRETTIYQVKQLYYAILLAKEMYHLIDEGITKITERIAEEDAKEEKELDPYNILKLKETRVDLERRRAESVQNMELAYEGLRVLMDLEPRAPVELDSNNIHPEIVTLGAEQDYLDAAMVSEPDSRLLDIGVDTKREQYRLEKFKLMPDAGFAFFADVGRTSGFVAGITATGDYNNPFNYTRAGIGLQLKGTLDFNGSYARIKKARAEYYKATYDRLIARRGLSLDVRKAYLNAKRMQEDVARAKKGDSIARQMVFVQKANIDMGIGDNDKYGDALMLMLVQRGYYFKAIFDYNIALADLAQKVTLARYEQLTTVPQNVEEYEAFEAGAGDEEFETYGIESGPPPKAPVEFTPREEIAPAPEAPAQEAQPESTPKP